jgi:hypothetical protein
MIYFLNKNIPVINYLFTITDDTGIFQHSVYGIPDPKKGYTTDDNARALILAVMLYENTKEQSFLNLVIRYLSFMLNAQNSDGNFKNFMDYERNFIEEVGSEDCLGRCLWALGRTLSSSHIPLNIKRTCQYMLKNALHNLDNLKSPRSKAYSLIGLTYANINEKFEEPILQVSVLDSIEMLSSSLVNQYNEFRDDNWHWFENIMAYSNAIMPWSLLRAYNVLEKKILVDVAEESVNFMEKITIENNYFKPIGCNGWYKKNFSTQSSDNELENKPARYDEQPIEACETLLMYIDYYKITKDIKFLDRAFKCFNWYRGHNSKGLCLIDSELGACYDGICDTGLNYNQGSESTISYGISLIEMSRIYLLRRF